MNPLNCMLDKISKVYLVNRIKLLIGIQLQNVPINALLNVPIKLGQLLRAGLLFVGVTHKEIDRVIQVDLIIVSGKSALIEDFTPTFLCWRRCRCKLKQG